MKQEVKYTKMLTTKDLLEILQCSPQTITSAIARGKLKIYSKIQGLNLYTADDVYNWISSRKRGATPTFMDNLTKEEFYKRCENLGLDYSEF